MTENEHNENENEQPTMQELLASFGLVEVQDNGARGITPWMRNVYSEVENGAIVYVFDSTVSDDAMLQLASLDTFENGENVALQVTDAEVDADNIRTALWNRSTLNIVGKGKRKGKTRLDVTLGAISRPRFAFADDNGTPHAVIVQGA